jgi:hypothetical protein
MEALQRILKAKCDIQNKFHRELRRSSKTKGSTRRGKFTV